MRANFAVLSVAMLLGAATTSTTTPAQSLPQPGPMSSQPGYSAANCSGFFTDQKLPDEMRLISGEEAEFKVVFARATTYTSIADRIRVCGWATASWWCARKRTR